VKIQSSTSSGDVLHDQVGMDQSWVCTRCGIHRISVQTRIRYGSEYGTGQTMVWTRLWYGPKLSLYVVKGDDRISIQTRSWCGLDPGVDWTLVWPRHRYEPKFGLY
jgi:hypothetical protein